MSNPFDPYYTWLGIPPEQQPPNHYRLLGLQMFEGNLDAIEHAADRQMAHLRSLQAGKHTDFSQRLLNEVARARIDLLNPDTKATYDTTLRAQLSNQVATVAMATTVEGPVSTPRRAVWVETKGSRRHALSAPPPRRQKLPRYVAYAMLPIAAAVVIVLEVLWWPRPAEPVPSRTILAGPVEPKDWTLASFSNATRSIAVGALPLDQWTDLLPRIDLAQDLICGPWEQKENAIHVGSYPDRAEQGFSRMVLPVNVEGGYDVELTFVRETPHSWASLLLPVGSQGCVVLLGVDQQTALSLVDGHVVSGSPMRQADALPQGRPSVVRVSVHLQGENATLEATLDGKPLLQWAGHQRSLSSTANWALPEGARFGLGGMLATFHRVRLRPIHNASADRVVTGQLPKNTVHGESLPAGEWVDVLQFADADRGCVWGKWERRGEEIVANRSLWSASLGHPRLWIPVEIDGSYDLQVEFTRTEDVNMVGVVLPVGSHRAAVLMDEGALVDKAAGIEQIDGLGVRNNATSKRSEGVLTNGQRYVARYQVRVDGDRVQIEVFLNDQPFLQWAGDQSRLGAGSAWKLPGPHALGLVASATSATFHAVRLRLTSGKAVVTSPRRSIEPKPGDNLPIGAWVDVLQWTGPDWGLVRGEWTRRGTELVAGCVKWSPAGHPRIALPVDIQGSYDLEVEFTRTQSPFIVATILPLGSRHVTMLFDQGGLADKASGLEPIDGRTARDNPTGKRGPPVLTNGQRYVVLHQVRVDGDRVQIEVFLDERPFLRWSGSLKQLTENPQWSLPGPNLPGLAASDCGAVFHAVRLRLVSGKATRVDTAGSSK